MRDRMERRRKAAITIVASSFPSLHPKLRSEDPSGCCAPCTRGECLLCDGDGCKCVCAFDLDRKRKVQRA